jgi:hypothetical protein
MLEVSSDYQRMQDYIVGRLPEDELRRFEDRLLRDPELVREFEQTLRLREGLEHLRARGDLGRAAFKTTVRRWLPALAAAVVAGIAIGLWFGRDAPLPGVLLTSTGVLSGSPASAPVNTYPLISTRGSETQPLTVPNVGVFEFYTVPGLGTNESHYGVKLEGRDSSGRWKTIRSLGDLAVKDDGNIHFYIDARQLMPGSYQLSVAPLDAPMDQSTSYPFNVSAKDLKGIDSRP